jgi:radical SAM family uncharacterized protein/radical SAM-linked protein
MKELLPLLQRPSRYLGSEWGAIHRDPAQASVHLGLAFPDLYDIGMSYLGQKILYELANGLPGCYAERIFTPTLDVAEVLREHDAPLATLETDTPLGELDLLAFHVTHELCYTNILFMLDLAGLPLRAADRDGSHPLVIAGGGCVLNAEPLAPFVDVMALGDGEAVLPGIVAEVERAKADNANRDELLRRLADLQGVYVPAYFDDEGRLLVPGREKVKRAVVEDLDAIGYPTRQVLPFGQAVHDRYALEIARGCTRGCRFCHAGMVYRPVRERDLPVLDDLLGRGLAESGFEELSFLSLSTGDFSALENLFTRSFDRCRAEQVAISLPSLRVGSVSPKLMNMLAAIRRTGATLAPEAGSQRLRDVINKGITREALETHVDDLFARGWQQVKLYFMIGLPTETDDDLYAIYELAAAVAAIGKRRGVKRLQVSAAVSPFVPKPHTPFQWEGQIDQAEIERRVELLRELFRNNKKLRLRWHEPGMSELEGVFSRGDRALADAVELAYRRGELFSSWVDHLNIDTWREVFAETRVDVAAYLGPRDVDARLPWDHIDAGVTKRFLLAERKRALEGQLTEDCRYGACRNCGACELDREEGLRNRLVFSERDQAEPEGECEVEAPSLLDEHGKPRGPGEELIHKAIHLRIWYAKLGPARFLSTLELQVIFERAMRRAGLKMSFSKGFHPLPLFNLGRALPVGVASHAEWVNVFLREVVPPEDTAALLGAQMPEGLEIKRVEQLSMGRKQPQSIRERYELTWSDAAVGETIRNDWRSFAESASFEVERETKKGPRTTDIRPLVTDIEVGEEAVRFTGDWRELYLSPLVIAQSVSPEPSPVDWLLTKLEQHFA